MREERGVAAEGGEDFSSSVEGAAAVHVAAEVWATQVPAALPVRSAEEESVGVGMAGEEERVVQRCDNFAGLTAHSPDLVTPAATTSPD